MPEQPVDPYAPPEVPKEKAGGILRVGIMGVLLVGAGVAYAVTAANNEPIGANEPQILAQQEEETGEYVAHQYADAGNVASDATPGAAEPAATPAAAPEPAPAQRRAAPRPEPTRATAPAPTPAPVTPAPTVTPTPTPAPVSPAPLTPDPLAPAPTPQPAPEATTPPPTF